MLEVTKLIKNDWLSMFFMANVASLGMLGLSFMIWIANSFIESIIAKNSVSCFPGRFSETSSILALI